MRCSHVASSCILGLYPGIFALKHESKIISHCWDVLKVVTCLQSSLWALPHIPIAGLKNWFENEKQDVVNFRPSQQWLILLSCFRAKTPVYIGVFGTSSGRGGGGKFAFFAAEIQIQRTTEDTLLSFPLNNRATSDSNGSIFMLNGPEWLRRRERERERMSSQTCEEGSNCRVEEVHKDHRNWGILAADRVESTEIHCKVGPRLREICAWSCLAVA